MGFFSSLPKTALLLLLNLGLATPILAQETNRYDFQFANKPIADILRSIGSISGRTVMPDETVTGVGSYFLSSASFDEAMELILSDNNLYTIERNGVYQISRVLVQGSEENLTLHAEQVSADLILRKVAIALGQTILFDPLSREPISVHLTNGTVEQLLQVVAAKNPRFSIETNQGFFYLRNQTTIVADSSGPQPAAADTITVHDDGSYSIQAVNLRVSLLLEELFRKADREYIYQKRGDGVIDRLFLTNKSFDVILQAILSLSDSHFVERADGIYIILDLNREEILKQYRQVRQVFIHSMPVQEMIGLIPSGLASSASYRLDVQGNSVILFGSTLEIEPVIAFFRSIDEAEERFNYVPVRLSFISPAQLVQILPSRYKITQPLVQEDTKTVLLYLPEDRVAEALDFVQLLDRPVQSYPIRLQYIQSSLLMESLPPGIPAGSVLRSPDPRLVFFQGTEAQLNFLREQLQSIDAPTPQIRYQLLVVQYQDRYKLDITPGFGASPSGTNEAGANPFTFVGNLGRLLNINFDILSSFGYNFAVDLTSGIENSTAQVLADTTLTAISGQEVSFQNTNTFRFRENERDEDTNQVTPTGPSREIVSGIIFNISGWVSGNNMVTMDISATVSKRGTASSESGSLPPTSEKVISTHVRTQAGMPVIIGGLVQQEIDDGSSRTPILGEIPVVENLFSSRLLSQDNTELVMYIVPYIDIPEAEHDPLAIMTTFYSQHFGNEQR